MLKQKRKELQKIIDRQKEQIAALQEEVSKTILQMNTVEKDAQSEKNRQFKTALLSLRGLDDENLEEYYKEKAFSLGWEILPQESGALVATAFCQYEGHAYNYIKFDTRRAALEFCYLMAEIDYTVPTGICPLCYQKHCV